jgi:hypothetical protein
MIDIAVIVEPRLHQYLKPVIDNMLRNINDETPIQIFHSKINENFLIKNYNILIENKKIILTKIKLFNRYYDNLSILLYNKLLTSNKFWEEINGENILIFQTDSCMCRHINTFDFTPYMEYGFIGAPSKYNFPIWLNGGFSLRKKSAMLKAIKAHKNIPISGQEDKFFTVCMKKYVNPAPYELGKLFSVEQYFYDNPLGIHKAWKYLSKDHWEYLKNKFPEISLTFNI